MAEKAEKISYAFQKAARVSFANIVKPRAFKGKGEERYSAAFVVAPDSDDLKTLKTLVQTELQKQYPGKRLKNSRLSEEQMASGEWVEINVPWKDGTKEADKAKANGKDQEFYRGQVVIKASSKYPPALSSVAGGKFTDFTDADTRPALEKLFYSGAYVAPAVSLNTYKASDDGKPGGCGLWLDMVCFVKDGPRLGGTRANAAEVFRNHIGHTTDVDPGTNAEDDEI